MSSRIARLVARLDALSQLGLPAAEHLEITRLGDELVIRLPPGVVAALDLRAGDRVAVQMPGQRSLSFEIHHQSLAPPPYQPI